MLNVLLALARSHTEVQESWASIPRNSQPSRCSFACVDIMDFMHSGPEPSAIWVCTCHGLCKLSLVCKPVETHRCLQKAFRAHELDLVHGIVMLSNGRAARTQIHCRLPGGSCVHPLDSHTLSVHVWDKVRPNRHFTAILLSALIPIFLETTILTAWNLHPPAHSRLSSRRHSETSDSRLRGHKVQS